MTYSDWLEQDGDRWYIETLAAAREGRSLDYEALEASLRKQDLEATLNRHGFVNSYGKGF